MCVSVSMLCSFRDVTIYNWYSGDPSNVVVYLYVVCWMCSITFSANFIRFEICIFMLFSAIRLFGSIFNASNTFIFLTFDVDACERTDDQTIYVTFVRGIRVYADGKMVKMFNTEYPNRVNDER